MLIPLNITGGTYPAKAIQLTSKVTRNFYPEIVDKQYILSPWPGSTVFGSSSGSDRGMLAHKGVLYKVSGITLYSVDSAGTHTSLGTIVGSTQCILVGFGNGVLIANGGGKVYYYDVTLREITDSDLETPLSVDQLNNIAIFDGDSGRFVVSAVGDPESINGLDYATAESNADDIVRVYVFRDKVLLFGQKTTEQWHNSGAGRPPFDKVPGIHIPIGLGARMSVSHNDNAIYYFGDNRSVYQGINPISQQITDQLRRYITVDDAIGFCFTLQDQNFYHLSFPTEDVTWVYSESVGEWFNLSRSNSTGRNLANSYAYIYDKHLVANYSDSTIYQWDFETYTEDSNPIHRERTTGTLHAGLLGQPGKDIELDRFELILERGQGDVTTTDPLVMLQVSYNGGKTFGTEMWGSIGESGEFMQKLVWYGLGRSENFVFRIKTSDPVFYSIHSANADINLTI